MLLRGEKGKSRLTRRNLINGKWPWSVRSKEEKSVEKLRDDPWETTWGPVVSRMKFGDFQNRLDCVGNGLSRKTYCFVGPLSIENFGALWGNCVFYMNRKVLLLCTYVWCWNSIIKQDESCSKWRRMKVCRRSG